MKIYWFNGKLRITHDGIIYQFNNSINEATAIAMINSGTVVGNTKEYPSGTWVFVDNVVASTAVIDVEKMKALKVVAIAEFLAV